MGLILQSNVLPWNLTFQRSIVRSNPFKPKSCERDRCEMCSTHEINCKTQEVIYEISCMGINKNGQPCEGIDYDGETSRSIGERNPEHLRLMSSNKESVRKKSFIFDHAKEEHGGTIPPMKVKIVAQCLGDPGLRQAVFSYFQLISFNFDQFYS